MQNTIQFEVSDLRMQNVQQMLESVSFLIVTLIVASLLPNVLITYVYKDQIQMMTSAPFWVEHGSMIVFAIGLLYFVYALVSVLMRNRKIKTMKKQLAMMAVQPSANQEEVAAQQAELAKLEKMVDEALNESQPKTAKKATKSKKK